MLPATLLGLAEESSGCGTLFTPQLLPQADTRTCPPTDGSGVFGKAAWEAAFVVALTLLSLALAVAVVRRARRRAPAPV